MRIGGVERSAYKFKTGMNCQMKYRFAWRHNWSRAHAIIVILLSSVLFRTIWSIPLPILNWLDHGRSFYHLYLMIIKMGITCISMQFSFSWITGNYLHACTHTIIASNVSIIEKHGIWIFLVRHVLLHDVFSEYSWFIKPHRQSDIS